MTLFIHPSDPSEFGVKFNSAQRLGYTSSWILKNTNNKDPDFMQISLGSDG